MKRPLMRPRWWADALPDQGPTFMYRMKLVDGTWSAWYEHTEDEFQRLYLDGADETFEYERLVWSSEVGRR